MRRTVWLVIGAIGVIGCVSRAPLPPAAPAAISEPTSDTSALEAARAAVRAPDRSEADRGLDAGRHPAEVLAFFNVRAGDRVAEIGTGGGYTAELLARIVGPAGHVWGQNSAFILQRFAEAPWTERLAKPVMANVTRLDAPFDAPFPAELAGSLDAVVNVLFYHDAVWQSVDRSTMNLAIFEALKPGGVYGIVDHSARPEDGLTVTQSLHRIGERELVDEILAAGFVLEASLDTLRNPADARDWSASPGAAGELRGQSDRFVLRFRRPVRPG